MTHECKYVGKSFWIEECPCCAGEPAIGISRDVNGYVAHAYVYCKDCGVRTNATPIAVEYSAIDISVKKWNRRDGM